MFFCSRFLPLYLKGNPEAQRTPQYFGHKQAASFIQDLHNFFWRTLFLLLQPVLKILRNDTKIKLHKKVLFFGMLNVNGGRYTGVKSVGGTDWKKLKDEKRASIISCTRTSRRRHAMQWLSIGRRKCLCQFTGADEGGWFLEFSEDFLTTFHSVFTNLFFNKKDS